MNLLKKPFILAFSATLAIFPGLQSSQASSSASASSSSSATSQSSSSVQQPLTSSVADPNSISAIISRQAQAIQVSRAQMLYRRGLVPVSRAQQLPFIRLNFPPMNIQALNKLMANGQDRHMFLVGMLFYSEKRYKAASNCFMLADEGSWGEGTSSNTAPCLQSTIRIGEIYAEGLGITANPQKALEYLTKAYKHIMADNQSRAMTARGLGDVYFKQGEYKQAYAYFEEALKLGSTTTTDHPENRVTSFPDPAIKLAEINLYGLGVEENLGTARAYLATAFQQNNSTAKTTAMHLFYQMKQLLVQRFNTALKKAVSNPSNQLIGEASCILAEIRKIEGKYLTANLNAILDVEVKAGEQQLRECLKKSHQPASESSDQKTKKTQEAAVVEAEQKAETSFQVADLETAEKDAFEKQKAFLERKKSDAHYCKTSSALIKALQIAKALHRPEDIKTIRKKLDEMAAARNQAQLTSDSKEEKKTTETASKSYKILDPFEQLQKNLNAPNLASIQARLKDLANNPLQIPQSKKYRSLTKTQETAVSSGYRILYIFLPEYRSVGIINIGPHKELDENFQVQENWFLKPSATEIYKKIEQAEQHGNQKQAKALKAFLLQAEDLHALAVSGERKV